MTREESQQLFTEIREYLNENEFKTPKSEGGEYSKNNFKGDYMIFNCPHICSTVKLFKVPKKGQSLPQKITGIRTSFARPLEWNKELVFNFLDKVIKEYYGENNTVQE